MPPASNIQLNITLPYTPPFVIDAQLKGRPTLDFALAPILRRFHPRNVIRLFSLLLLERSVLLHSQNIALLTRFSEFMLAVLFPLHWELVYVPLVPEILQGTHIDSLIRLTMIRFNSSAHAIPDGR